MALPRIHWNDPSVAKFDAVGREGKELLHSELSEAIYDDDLDWKEESKKLCALRDSGGSLEIIAHKRIVLKPEMFRDLDDIKYELEEQHCLSGDDGTNWEEFTPEGLAEVKAAYDAFVSTFIKHYHVWACEPAAVIVVPVKELYDEADALAREECFGEKTE